MPDAPLHNVHPNVRLAWIIGSLITVGVLTLIGAVAELSFAMSTHRMPWPAKLPLVSVCAGVILAAIAVVMSVLQYRRFGYALSGRDLVVQSGVFWQVRRCVPRARVQHVDVQSGPVDRALGLAELRVYVAGSSGAVATITGLSPEVADQLKEALIVERADLIQPDAAGHAADAASDPAEFAGHADGV